MENKQKRKLLTSIYKTINLFSLVALALVLYLEIDKLSKGNNNILWLDVTLIVMTGFLLLYMLADNISTRKLTNKYKIAKFFYFLFFNTVVGLIVLSVCCYFMNVDIFAYIYYALPLGLIFVTELVLIINFILGISVTKLRKNSTITLDSMSDTPNFNDEVMLKKRLDELNRKLAMKKIQDEIDKVQKELDK